MQRRCAVHGQWVITLTHQILPVILALYCLQVRNESYKEFNIWLYFGEFSRLKSQWAADVRAATWEKLYWSSQLLCDLFSLHCTITLNLRAPPDAKSHFDPRWQHACTATEPSDHLTGSIRVTDFSFHCLTSVYLTVVTVRGQQQTFSERVLITTAWQYVGHIQRSIQCKSLLVFHWAFLFSIFRREYGWIHHRWHHSQHRTLKQLRKTSRDLIVEKCASTPRVA